MTMALPRDRLFALLAAVWLAVAVGAAAADWPTPDRLSRERLQMALLWANALDKELRPYDTPLWSDPDAQYRELVADYQARFGDRFDISLIAKRHDEAVSGMAGERVGIVAFAAAATGAVWWLLFTIRNLLGPRGRQA